MNTVLNTPQELLTAEFDYADDELVSLDPAEVTIPKNIAEELQEAAHHYSATRLEKGLTQLESGHEMNKKTAAYLRRLAKDGDLDAVAEFLEKTRKGNTRE